MRSLIVLFIFFIASSAHAANVDDARKQLSGTLSEIQSAAKKQKELQQKQAALEREMKPLQQQMVTIARDAKEQEEALSVLEEKSAILEGQKNTITRSLEERKAQLSTAISAMVKLGKLPPEAVIAMPGKLQETLLAARTLGVITKAVDEEAASLKAQLHELDDLEQKIARNRENVLSKKNEVTERQKQLADKIRERARLQAALGGEEKQEKERMARLTEKSKTLEDLVQTLGRSERATPESSPPAARSRFSSLFSKERKPRSLQQAKGKLGLPAAGKIVGLYGHSEDGAAFSKGMIMETRQATGVVAPYDGEVVYAGVFRDYGKMVIIRHNGDYHTLLSGMDTINCAPGQLMLEGEPIGAMGKPLDGVKPRLYIEMRKNGKPIDPMAWFKG